jgi:ABC-2 type transporter
MKGLLQHLLLTLRLNFRSKMPVIYGYLVPVFFLIGFAAVFGAEQPPLVRELGQLLTISVLGGACFGLPTALVAERQQGIWRRYRLLPLATESLVVSTLAARLVLVASAAALQILLAVWIYKMPWPALPGQLIVAFVFVAWAFLGMGLVIAMLAETVPAVQALGQAIFLPMILIGGVGVPLRVLPHWAQIVADFMPGRYAVTALNVCVMGGGLPAARFSLAALAVIGAAACLAGGNMFRWDAGQKIGRRQKIWAAAALAAWAGVGLAAQAGGQASQAVVSAAPAGYQSITQAQINSITYGDLQPDQGLITPLVDSVDDLSPQIQHWVRDFRPKLAAWPAGQSDDPVQRTRNLLSVAAVADLAEFQYEGEVPWVVFGQLKAQMPRKELEQVLAQIILRPNQGQVLTSAADLGIPGRAAESAVRDRVVQYAKKLLGRLLGKLS